MQWCNINVALQVCLVVLCAVESAVASLNHRVIKRSDDVTPFEAALNHVTGEVTKMAAAIAALQAAQQASQATSRNAGGSVFTRWGSTDCGDAELVYVGAMGGANYNHAGGATNYLCLSLDPVAANRSVTRVEQYLYGAEYETGDAHTQDKDAVCAVCRASQATTIMIPGTTRCPSAAWSRQYAGFLMAGAYNAYSGSEYICVDSGLAVADHSEKNDDGRLLYFTQTWCGSLPCPPYQHKTIATCAVCSK